MTRIAVSTLVLVALVAGVAAYFLTGSLLGSLPPLGWGWVTLPVVALIDVLLALRIRSAMGSTSDVVNEMVSTAACMFPLLLAGA